MKILNKYNSPFKGSEKKDVILYFAKAMMLLCGVLFFVICGLSACQSNHKPKLTLPTNVEFVNYNTKSQIDSIFNKPLKIVVWADSTGCTGCKLQLDTWEYAINDFQKIAPESIGYLFYLQFRDRHDLEFFLGMDDGFDEEYEEEYEDESDWDDEMFDTRFSQPVIWDSIGRFGQLNSVSGYKCYIINQNNEILYEGEPPFTPEERNKYTETIVKYLKKD